MKKWITLKKIPLITTFIGSMLGLAYWKYIGCESGSCAITSVWYRSMIYGALMGWLLGDLMISRKDKKQDEQTQ